MTATTTTPCTSTTTRHKLLTALGIALCVMLTPILAVNAALIVRSYTNPDEVPSVGGIAPLIVLSDSMYPTIRKGDLILCHSVDPVALATGDVIAFFDPEVVGEVAVVVHRIVDIEDGEDGLAFVTQGDANDAVDAHVTQASDVIGRYQTRLPGVGDAAMFLQTTPGFVVCVGVPVLAFVSYDTIRTRMIQRHAVAS